MAQNRKTQNPDLTADVRSMAERVPEGKRAAAEALANELIFMQSTLKALKQYVAEHGAVELFKNGRQEYLRESPALKSYTSLIGKYGTLLKQLAQLMPSDDTDPMDEIDQWLNEHPAAAPPLGWIPPNKRKGR